MKPGPVLVGQPVNMIEIVVPAGAYPGNQLLVTNPYTQQQFQVTVPQGLAPGMSFQVQVPVSGSPLPPAPVMGHPQQLSYMQPPPPAPQMTVQQPPQVVHHHTTVVRERRQPAKDDDCASGFAAGLCFCCALDCLASAATR